MKTESEMRKSQKTEYKASWRDEDLKWVCGTRKDSIRVIGHAIVKLLTDPELAKIQTAQEISNRIKDLKFGKIKT